MPHEKDAETIAFSHDHDALFKLPKLKWVRFAHSRHTHRPYLERHDST